MEEGLCRRGSCCETDTAFVMQSNEAICFSSDRIVIEQIKKYQR